MMNMLDEWCNIYRNTTTKDPEFGRPVKSLNLVDKFPCMFSKKKQSYTKGKPNATIEITHTMFGEADMDIKEGDIVERLLTGEKFIAAPPDKPGNDHTEVDVGIERDA